MMTTIVIIVCKPIFRKKKKPFILSTITELYYIRCDIVKSLKKIQNIISENEPR